MVSIFLYVWYIRQFGLVDFPINVQCANKAGSTNVDDRTWLANQEESL